MKLKPIKTEQEYDEMMAWIDEQLDRFVDKLGSKSYASAVLNRRKPMTLDMAKFFHNGLGIPAHVLLA